MIFLALALPTRPHPFFVSVTEIEYSTKDRTLGVSTKLFYDDMEKTLKQFTGKEVDIMNGDKKQNSAYISAYFSKHFSMANGTTAVPWKMIGYEIEADAIFIYLEAPLAAAPGKLTVTTDLLYDLDRSQINMVHYMVNGTRQSHRLNYPNREVVFESK